MEVTFRIFPEDDFIECVAEYFGKENVEDVTDEEIKCFIEDHIKPAQSMHPSFAVEGGDTDGWFVDFVNTGR